MAFIGNEAELDWKKLPAGSYFILQETGEVYDSEHEAENACFASSGATDDDDVTYDDIFQIDTYRVRKVDPYLVTRQSAWDRPWNSVNVCRDPDSVPCGALIERPAYPDVECATRDEAIEVAKEYAARWAIERNEPVQVDSDTAEWGGDILYTALPSGLLFEGEPEMDEAA